MVPFWSLTYRWTARLQMVGLLAVPGGGSVFSFTGLLSASRAAVAKSPYDDRLRKVQGIWIGPRFFITKWPVSLGRGADRGGLYRRQTAARSELADLFRWSSPA